MPSFLPSASKGLRAAPLLFQHNSFDGDSTGLVDSCGFEKGMTEGGERLIVLHATRANQSIPEPWFGGYTHTMRSVGFCWVSLLLPYEKKKS